MRVLRLGKLLAGALGITTIAACGLSLVGTASVTGDGADASNQGPDGATRFDEAGNPIISDGDGSVNDAGGGTGGDGASEASVFCPTPSTTFTSGTLTVAPAAAHVTIDGDLKEWQCARFFDFNKSNAGAQIGTDLNIANVYSFAVAWDALNVYVAIKATDPTPQEGNTPLDVFNNDGVELYLGGTLPFNGTYSTKDHQWVVDWANRTREYQNSPGKAPSATGFESAVMMTPPLGFRMEIRVSSSELGHPSFATNDKLGFAFVGLDSDGTARSSWMLWYRPSKTCSGCCQVYCNTNFFGDLVLGP